MYSARTAGVPPRTFGASVETTNHASSLPGIARNWSIALLRLLSNCGKRVLKKRSTSLLKSFVPAMNNTTSGLWASSASERSAEPPVQLLFTILHTGGTALLASDVIDPASGRDKSVEKVHPVAIAL